MLCPAGGNGTRGEDRVVVSREGGLGFVNKL